MKTEDLEEEKRSVDSHPWLPRRSADAGVAAGAEILQRLGFSWVAPPVATGQPKRERVHLSLSLSFSLIY